MKSYFTWIVDYWKCERNVLLSSLAVLFLMGMNFNKEALSAFIMIPSLVILFLFGLISYLALVYWIQYFWSQYTTADKIIKLGKAIFLTILFVMAVSCTFVYIDHYLSYPSRYN